MGTEEQERHKDRYRETELKYKRLDVMTRGIGAFAAIASAAAAFMALQGYSESNSSPQVVPALPNASPVVPNPASGTPVNPAANSPARGTNSTSTPATGTNSAGTNSAGTPATGTPANGAATVRPPRTTVNQAVPPQDDDDDDDQDDDRNEVDNE